MWKNRGGGASGAMRSINNSFRVGAGLSVVGILVLGAGLYYRAQEKHDPESKKIYTVVSLVGLAVTAVCAALLICG